MGNEQRIIMNEDPSFKKGNEPTAVTPDQTLLSKEQSQKLVIQESYLQEASEIKDLFAQLINIIINDKDSVHIIHLDTPSFEPPPLSILTQEKESLIKALTDNLQNIVIDSHQSSGKINFWINNFQRCLSLHERFKAGLLESGELPTTSFKAIEYKKEALLEYSEQIRTFKLDYIEDKNIFKISLCYTQDGLQRIIERETTLNSNTSYRIFNNAEIVLLEDNWMLLQGDWPANCDFYFNLKNIAIGGIPNKIKKIDINAQKIVFLNKFSIANLHVKAAWVLNLQQELHTQIAHLYVESLSNPRGKIISAKQLYIKAYSLNNQKGGLYAGGECKIISQHLNNLKGHISGICGTIVKTRVCLVQDAQSQIGSKSNQKIEAWLKQAQMAWENNDSSLTNSKNITYIEYCANAWLGNLGIICGDSIYLTNVMTNGHGIIVGDKVFLKNPTDLIMPNVEIKAKVLRIKASDFRLGNNVDCMHTILEISGIANVVLKHPYKTTGTFSVQEPNITRNTIEQCMKERFGEVAKYTLATMPTAEYILTCNAAIQADAGVTFLAPRAKVYLGDVNQALFATLLAEKGKLHAYVTEFDVRNGGIVAVNAKLWSPRGVYLGRLMEDQTRRVFATFYAHQNRAESYSLSTAIVPKRYQFLGRDVPVYDGRHLLIMPVAKSNESFFYTRKGEMQNIGALYNKGTLETNHFMLYSPNITSEVEVGEVVVHGECTLEAKVVIKNYTTTFEYGYYMCERTVYNPKIELHFYNSDSAKFIVYGKSSGHGAIINQSAHIFIQTPNSTSISIESVDFTAGLYQKLVTSTPEGFQALKNSSQPHLYRGVGVVPSFLYPAGIARPYNFINDFAGGLSYAIGFLMKTKNFCDAQKVFPARTNFNSQVVLSANNTRIEGILNAPALLIRVRIGDKLILGSSNPYHISSQSPIRDLMEKRFNGHLVYISQNLKQILESTTQPKIYFKLQERFWHNAKESQNFYMSIADKVVVYNNNTKNFTRPKMLGAIFNLSPGLLLETVQEECNRILMRGYFTFGQALDLTCLKELHHNMVEYLKSIHLLAEEADAQALVTKIEASIKMAPNPMIYYISLINDQGLEEFFPRVYIPETMINEARAQHGDLIKTNLLCIVPEYFNSDEWLLQFEKQSAVKKILLEFFENNPKAKGEIDKTALVAKSRLALTTEALSNVTLNGNIKTQRMAVIIEGKLTVHANLEAEQEMFLASLLDNVEVHSLIERKYLGNNENFNEVVSQALLKAKDILILAGKNTLFVGAKTYAEFNMHVEALAHILDIPIQLMQQRVTHFYGKRKSGTVVETWIN